MVKFLNLFKFYRNLTEDEWLKIFHLEVGQISNASPHKIQCSSRALDSLFPALKPFFKWFFIGLHPFLNRLVGSKKPRSHGLFKHPPSISTPYSPPSPLPNPPTPKSELLVLARFCFKMHLRGASRLVHLLQLLCRFHSYASWARHHFKQSPGGLNC